MARGPLRPPLRMRLDIDRWSSPPLQTALELTPSRYVRPSAAYFRAGHSLLDSLVLSLAQYAPTHRVNRVTVSQPPTLIPCLCGAALGRSPSAAPPPNDGMTT
jgi:hypothetical protein